MATAAGIIFTAGALTLANEALGVPYSQSNTDIVSAINWKVIPATGIAAALFTGLSQLSEPVAKRLAYLVLFTSLFAGFGTAPSIIQRLNDVMGFNQNPANPAPVSPQKLQRLAN